MEKEQIAVEEQDTSVEEQDGPKVIEVKKPEDWPEAAEVKQRCWIPTVRGKAQLDLRSLSYAEENKIYDENKNPEPPAVKRRGMVVNNPDDPKYQAACRDMSFRRCVAMIDVCWKPLPGESLTEKVDWAREHLLREGEIFAVQSEIQDVSGYKAESELEEGEEEEDSILLTSPEDWAKNTTAPSFFRIGHGDEILRFQLKGIAGTKIKSIDASCDPGPPPVEVVKGLDGRRGTPAPNPTSPRYMKLKRDKDQAQRVMFLEATLPFDIPGATIGDKLEWLGKRPAGEVIRLYTFARHENLSYRDKADFTSRL